MHLNLDLLWFDADGKSDPRIFSQILVKNGVINPIMLQSAKKNHLKQIITSQWGAGCADLKLARRLQLTFS